jgi:hypothetical protein
VTPIFSPALLCGEERYYALQMLAKLVERHAKYPKDRADRADIAAVLRQGVGQSEAKADIQFILNACPMPVEDAWTFSAEVWAYTVITQMEAPYDTTIEDLTAAS